MINFSRHPVLTEDYESLIGYNLAWGRLDDKVVLVTGAMGLIASYLIDSLMYRNEFLGVPSCQVVALVRDAERAKAHFHHLLGRRDFSLLVQDVCEPLPKKRQFDFIIHAAGNATPRKFGEDPIGTYKAAVIGTHNLLAHAERTHCTSFLLLSSGSVHGNVLDEKAVIDETVMGVIDPLNPYSCYAESKRMAETMCASWTRQAGLPTRIARLGHSYGPGIRRNDDRAFAEFLYCVLDGRDIVLQSDGTAMRPYCYLSDVAHALLCILLQGGDGDAYIVANAAASCSIKDLALILANLAPERGIRVRIAESVDPKAVPNKDTARPINTEKLHSLGWVPRFDVRSGFERTFRSLK